MNTVYSILLYLLSLTIDFYKYLLQIRKNVLMEQYITVSYIILDIVII